MRSIVWAVQLLVAIQLTLVCNANAFFQVESLLLDSVRIEGAPLLDSHEIDAVVGRFVGRQVSFEDLEQMRHELTLRLIDKGYVSSGVILPDQEVKDGVLILRVVAGELRQVEIEGNEHFSTSWLESRLRRGGDGALNVNTLQQNLQQLQFDRSVRRINAELKAGTAPGESVLYARIEEKSPFWARVSLANDASPSTGSYRGGLQASYANLFGRGDRLQGSLGVSEGDSDYSLRFALPLTRAETLLELYGYKSESQVITDDFADLDIESDSKTFGVKITHPIYRSLASQLSLGLAGEQRQDQTSLLGENFSFSSGVDDGEARVSVVRFSQEFVYRSMARVLAIASSFNVGVDLFDATIHDNQPDGEFLTWLGQLRWVEQVGMAQAVLRIDGQLSDDELLPMEKFSVGGVSSVRGYRKDAMVRDRGVSASLEARLPLFGSLEGRGLTLIPFYDCGYAKDRGEQAADGKFVQSLGTGLRWKPLVNLSLELFYGYAFDDFDFDDEDLQDDGVHFALVWETP
ncbi:MAG: hypothetical protein C0614_00175 [Desulfuromonas sp.]|nr:MAG: hypothetical protein C0614_00175 [Desulfuromonas sp.]